MKFHITPRAMPILGAFVLASGVFLLALATPDIVSGNASREIEPFEDFDCLERHTDQQRQTQSAPAERNEEAESPSSGPG